MALCLEREIEWNLSLSPFRNLLRPATFPLLFQSPWRRVFEVRFFSPDTYLDEAWSWTFLNYENVQHETTWGNMSMISTDLTFSRMQTLAGRDGVVSESLTIRGIIHLGDFCFDECSMSVIERSCGIKIVYNGWQISYILTSPISNVSIFIFVILFHMIAFYGNSWSFWLEDSKIRFSTASICLRIALFLRRGRKMLWSEKSGPWTILVFIWFSDAITWKENIGGLPTVQWIHIYLLKPEEMQKQGAHTTLLDWEMWTERTTNRIGCFDGFPAFFDGPRMSKPRPS